MHDLAFAPGRIVARHELDPYHIKRMVLSPKQWADCSLPVSLRWEFKKFTEDNSKHIPNDCGGIYTFVVQPNIADHPACSYLMYVGKADNSLRSRYYKYLEERRLGDASRRPHVEEMLKTWEGYLWFYYAKVDRKDVIHSVEQLLLAAYLPPTNKEFPAEVRRALQRLFGN